MQDNPVRVTTIKKIFSVLLFAIFLFNTMGYYFVFKVNQSMIRSDIRAMIYSEFHKEMFILIRIDSPDSNPNFKKLDHDEFSYCGKLYDIVSESVKGNTTWYYCINDQQEERLITGFEKIQSFTYAFGSPDKIKHTLALLHNLITFALVNDPTDTIKSKPVDFIFCKYSNHPVNRVQSPVPPPPELS